MLMSYMEEFTRLEMSLIIDRHHSLPVHDLMGHVTQVPDPQAKLWSISRRIDCYVQVVFFCAGNERADPNEWRVSNVN